MGGSLCGARVCACEKRLQASPYVFGAQVVLGT